jgi:hypothetical protein
MQYSRSPLRQQSQICGLSIRADLPWSLPLQEFQAVHQVFLLQEKTSMSEQLKVRVASEETCKAPLNPSRYHRRQLLLSCCLLSFVDFSIPLHLRLPFGEAVDRLNLSRPPRQEGVRDLRRRGSISMCPTTRQKAKGRKLPGSFVWVPFSPSRVTICFLMSPSLYTNMVGVFLSGYPSMHSSARI